MSAVPADIMAPSKATGDEQFRFNVKIMPPRRPTNSLFRRLQQPKAEEPLHTIAVPARKSETFADVWKHIRERYERNYGAEEVAKGWFYKLQDRFGADIDSHDGVGALGYTPQTPIEERVLVMLQNEIDRDGSVPENSGLRPEGFGRPALTEEQAHQAKRRKVQEERYGTSLEELDEDTPIESREKRVGFGSPQLGGEDDDGGKIDADGFAVPALPGSVSRKRKRSSRKDNDVIQSSVEEENEDNVLVPGTQPAAHDEEAVPDNCPTDHVASRTRLRKSMPADATAGASAINTKGVRAVTAAPEAGTRGSFKKNVNLESPHVQNPEISQDRPDLNSELHRSPPTPVSRKSHLGTQRPPESAQRQKATPLVASTPAGQSAQAQPLEPQETSQNILDFDPIEDDDLLDGIADTVYDDFDNDESGFVVRDDISAHGGAPPSTNLKAKPGKLPKPNKDVAFTPKSSALHFLSGTQGSTSKNPRTSSGRKIFWETEEDAFLLQGHRQGLNAAQIIQTFDLENRTTSAVRGRLKLLLQKRPELSSQTRLVDDIDGDHRSAPSSSKKRSAWPLSDVQTMSHAIAEGFDALEIQAMYFSKRSEDAVNRKVLAVQDQVWMNASKNPLFPENHAGLDGWTLKDGCKLRRTFREGLPTAEAKTLFFGRWKMSEVQKQLDGYKAQIKALQASQGRAARATKPADDLTIESSQLPANSSPVERSMQARAARRPSTGLPRHRSAGISSSPSHDGAEQRGFEAEAQSLASAKRHSSPTVEISIVEQDRARTSLSRPPSGKSTQTKLNFNREKGKNRASAPRPNDQELDAQYTRRATRNSTAHTAAISQPENVVSITQEDGDPADDANEEHTPADDLEMLDAELEEMHEPAPRESPSSIFDEPNTRSTRQQPPVAGLERRRSSRQLPSPQMNISHVSGNSSMQPASVSSPASAQRRKSRSSQPSLLSPMMTRHDTALSSSDRRRQSRVESGVDTRAAVQLSQELQRSLSREGQEEEQQESQAFQTQDPSTSRSQRAAAAAANAMPIQELGKSDPDIDSDQGFQTQTSGANRSQHDVQNADAELPGFDAATKSDSGGLNPSPQIGTSNLKSTSVITPATTPATGKLPPRGQSYASKIRDIQRSEQTTAPNTTRKSESSERSESTSHNDKSGSEPHLQPPPTDAELWTKTANAEKLGKNRQEYFEDLKINAYSVRAMARGDWHEVNLLKAEQHRLHRQRQIGKGRRVSMAQDTQHPDGLAQGGDSENADEDVIRIDDDTSSESEVNEQPNGDIWSDADFEQPEEVDHDRHFSEVDGEEEDADLPPEPIASEVNHDRHANEVNEEDQPLDAIDATKEDPHQNHIEAPDHDEEDEEELELPTAPTITETNGDVHHALTDENLQELNNSGAEGSPVRHHKQPSTAENNIKPSSKDEKLQSDDRAAMPPPSKRALKRQERRKRKFRRHSEGASERSSLSHPVLSSDAPKPEIPSTPDEKQNPGHQNKKRKLSDNTPVSQTPKSSRKAQTHSNTMSSQAAQGPSIGGSQFSAGGGGGGSMGLSGLVRKAHIPTPPKAKPVPQKDLKSKRLTLNANDGDSDESSSDSD